MADDLVEIDEEGIRGTRSALDRLRPALRQVGIYLESQAQSAFREQGRGSRRWPPRMAPNVPGIVRDLNKGGAVKQRRFRPRPALVDTGRLRQSIRSRLQGRTLIVGTALDYGRTHQEGGTSVVELTQRGRDRLTTFLRKRTDLRERLGFLFTQPRLEVSVRKRPFMTVEDEDGPVIRRILEAHLTGATGGA